MTERFVNYMSKDALPAIANTAAAASVSTGFFSFISENASVISVLIAICTLLVSIIAHWVNASTKMKLADANTKKIELDQDKLKLEIKKMELDYKLELVKEQNKQKRKR